MKKGSILRVLGIVLVLCFIFCEPIPQNAIDDARSALDQAEKMGGQRWTPTQLKTGRACFDSAMQQLALEKKKLLFLRNYKEVIDLLDLAHEAGYFSMTTTKIANERMKSDSRNLLDLAKVLTDSVDKVLKTAALNKKKKKQLQAALDSARMNQQEALTELNSGDLLIAEDKATTAKAKAEEVAKMVTEILSSQKKTARK